MTNRGHSPAIGTHRHLQKWHIEPVYINWHDIDVVATLRVMALHAQSHYREA